ncbi:Flp pilus assembly protein TadD [Rhodovulum bhavnagarense]|uniref:Flp pilus assembly protein TadD n=1 Tax=Rhodovulum bhavnagarense TaxID=992286 RepID=A0A4R2RHJ9_9RHOB|nr:tetratricopeptide repeat protein [Rhodovulum bhavnagarense]TCP62264.1 Flp pilus assembly protein TadD [Rhodovulum bhavnagarense]
MRHVFLVSVCAIAALAVPGCTTNGEAEVERAVQDVLASDESSLNEIMMNVADPNEAVRHFSAVAKERPDDIAPKRGLARALIRAKRNTEGALAWAKVVDHPDATDDDRVDHADALIRNGDWKKAEKILDAIPPTFETYKRYRLEAMVADSNKEWEKADSFYETAVELTTRPSGVLNNWGYSKLSRGDYTGAERLFVEAITYDATLFTAKNNLVLARGAQRNYQLPIVEMTQAEKAQLFHTLALTAIKQGDVEIGRGLLKEAIDANPQHFEAAERALRALDSNVVN